MRALYAEAGGYAWFPSRGNPIGNPQPRVANDAAEAMLDWLDTLPPAPSTGLLGFSQGGTMVLGAPARPDGGRRTMTGRTVQLSANGCAISTVHPEGSQMTTASTGLAVAAYQELAAAPRADVITPADRGHDEAPRLVS